MVYGLGDERAMIMLVVIRTGGFLDNSRVCNSTNVINEIEGLYIN